MTMPEATMDLDAFPVTGESDIRPTGHSRELNPEPATERVEKASHDLLMLRVRPPDRAMWALRCSVVSLSSI